VDRRIERLLLALGVSVGVIGVALVVLSAPAILTTGIVSLLVATATT
jgi:hypothetical protein